MTGLTTGALAVAGVGSASGLAALVAKRLRARGNSLASCASLSPEPHAAHETHSAFAGSPSGRDRPIVTGGQP
jgi:hypothetical protein